MANINVGDRFISKNSCGCGCGLTAVETYAVYETRRIDKNDISFEGFRLKEINEKRGSVWYSLVSANFKFEKIEKKELQLELF